MNFSIVFLQFCSVLGAVLRTERAVGHLAVMGRLYTGQVGGDLPVAGLRLFYHQSADLHRLQPHFQAGFHPAAQVPVS